MTTFILHGGNVSLPSPENAAFFKHFTAHVKKPVVSIALVYWARPSQQWIPLAQRDQQLIQQQTTQALHCVIPQTPAELKKLLPKIDVLFVAGGDAEPIEALLPELRWLQAALKNKVYLGSSMGAFIASESYVLSHDAQDTTTVHQGLGLLPIQTLCHWDQEPHQIEKKALLAHYNAGLPIITLNEGESIVFEK